MLTRIGPSILLFAAVLGAWGQRPTPGANPAADWPMYNRDYASTRFSQLAEITPQNVTSLKQVCSYVLPEPSSTFESSLVAVDGKLYFTTAEYTYAIDAATCALRWRVRHELPSSPQSIGTVRGVAIAGNRIFRGFRDGTVAAYDSSEGKQIWATKLESPGGGRNYISASPIVWNGIVFIGTAGAETACHCEVAALDAATGRILWTFALIPTGKAPGAETWPKDDDFLIGGGSTWTSFTLDTATGALWVPAGNPGPDFSGDFRPGANLYTGSVVVLDAKSGKLRSWYQLVPHDTHDWDVTAPPALITTKLGKRRAIATGKDGYMHAIDIAAGKIAWKTAVTTIENADAPITVQGTHFCPGTAGGVEWNGPAYSGATNLLFVNSVDWCSTLRIDPNKPKYEEGKPYLGSANAFGDKDDRRLGWVTAVDADTGVVRWRYQAATPMLAGIVATASGLVVTADMNGDLLAFEAGTGKLLHRIATKQPAGGGIITYQIGGHQRIAMATGLEDRIFDSHGQPVVLVFGL